MQCRKHRPEMSQSTDTTGLALPQDIHVSERGVAVVGEMVNRRSKVLSC